VRDAKNIKGTGFELVSSICQSKINSNAGGNVVEASLQRRQSETSGIYLRLYKLLFFKAKKGIICVVNVCWEINFTMNGF